MENIKPKGYTNQKSVEREKGYQMQGYKQSQKYPISKVFEPAA